MSVKITGDFSRLEKLAENAEKLDGQKEVSLGDIINKEFIKANTVFQSIDDLFEKAGFTINTKEDLEAVPQEAIDSFIKENTSFDDFSDLQSQAVADYVRNQLFKGFN